MNPIPNSTASSSLYASYGFKTSEHQNESDIFEVLFTSKPDELSDKEKLDAAMSQLEASAKTGNRSSIDMLTNLAMRDDSLGKEAEKLLFKMFSAPSIGRATVAGDISKAALTLYESYKNAPAGKKFVAAEAKLNAPSLLLYMAGATADDDLQKMLSQRIFSKDVQAQEREQVGESNVWGINRFITHDELACVVREANNSNSGVAHFNSPTSLFENNLLNDTIAEILLQKVVPDWPQFFPVNTGDHWLLLGIQKPEESDMPTAFVFSSTPLDESERAALESAVEIAGIGGISYLDKNLQVHVPNGCGLFVADAMQKMANSPSLDPKDVIETVQKLALNMSPIDCEEYNLSGRRMLYGSLLVDCR